MDTSPDRILEVKHLLRSTYDDEPVDNYNDQIEQIKSILKTIHGSNLKVKGDHFIDLANIQRIIINK